MTQTVTAPPLDGLRDHVVRTLRLAWPLILSRIGITMMATVDVLVLGRAGADELSRYVLGFVFYDTLAAVLSGFVLGVAVLTARETGAARPGAAATIWHRGTLAGLGLAAALTVALQGSEALLLATGQTEAVASSSASVARIVALTLPAVALFMATTTFLEALHKPKIGLVAVAIANVNNVWLNILLVFGWGPIPALGAEGAAWATVINLTLCSLGLWLYTRFALRDRHIYGIGATRPAEVPRIWEQTRIGVAAAAAYTFEAGAFMVMTIMAGWLGPLALAVQGVVFSLLATAFMIAFGLANAAQVRVGNAWGRRDPSGMALAGWTATALATLFTGTIMVASLIFPEEIIRIFTDDPVLVAAALPVLLWVSLALVFDGAQTVMSHSCRGRGDAWMPSVLHFGSYWLVMVPVAYWLAIAREGGVAGLFQGILVASVISLVALSLRFRVLSRRPV
ncbi:MAG: MATE family efflux transporter [Pseudomonadota bacterium]